MFFLQRDDIVNKVEKVLNALFQSAGQRPADAQSASLLTMKYKPRPQMRPSAAMNRRRVQKDHFDPFELA
jgi:hypothetical protein